MGVRKDSSCLDWTECTKDVESAYGVDTRDFFKSQSQFNEWCDSKKYGKKDAEGSWRGSSNLWYQEYRQEVATGVITERPYCDFWHFIVKVVGANTLKNGGTFMLSHAMGFDAEPWQQTILAMYMCRHGAGPYRNAN